MINQIVHWFDVTLRFTIFPFLVLYISNKQYIENSLHAYNTLFEHDDLMQFKHVLTI